MKKKDKLEFDVKKVEDVKLDSNKVKKEMDKIREENESMMD